MTLIGSGWSSKCSIISSDSIAVKVGSTGLLLINRDRVFILCISLNPISGSCAKRLKSLAFNFLTGARASVVYCPATKLQIQNKYFMFYSIYLLIFQHNF